MSKREHAKMVSEALTYLTREELKRNNTWENESAKHSIKCLIQSLDFFLDDQTRDIYISSCKGHACFNLPTVSSLELSDLYLTPLDFVQVLSISIEEHLTQEKTSEHSKDSYSDMSLEPPLT